MYVHVSHEDHITDKSNMAVIESVVTKEAFLTPMLKYKPIPYRINTFSKKDTRKYSKP